MASFPHLTMFCVVMGWSSEVVGFGTVSVPPGSDGAESSDRKGVRVSLSFLVGDSSVDAMAERLAGRGIGLDEGPVTRPWNTREIVLVDPDRYRLVFFEAVDVTRTFEDVVGSVES